MKTQEFNTSNRFDDEGGDVVCARCGKNVTKPTNWIHLIDGGALVLHPDSENEYTPDNGEMGFHALGKECAKYFKGYLHTGEWETVAAKLST